MTRYLLDTTVLINHLRGEAEIGRLLLGLLRDGHSLCTSCVNVAEVLRGARPRDRKAAMALLDRLDFLPTTREAAARAGLYQAEFAKRGRTIHTPDALVAGTARAHGAIVITDDVRDFPMHDVRALPQPD